MSAEIMIVVEDRELGSYLRLSLMAAGANVHLSTSASEALGSMRDLRPEKRPRLLLVSAELTDLPAEEFLEVLCHEKRLDDSEVFVLSTSPTRTQLQVRSRKFLILDKVGDLDALIEAAHFYVHRPVFSQGPH
jgi:DNA-binding response OmpR family regulator